MNPRTTAGELHLGDRVITPDNRVGTLVYLVHGASGAYVEFDDKSVDMIQWRELQRETEK